MKFIPFLSPKQPENKQLSHTIFKTYSLLVSGLFVCITSVEAAKTPNPMVTDSRVKQVAYDPNQVYELVGTYGYQTSIEFDVEEQIKVVTLGDSIAWQTVPYQNRLFIKPVEPNAATNLTVLTNKRSYYFKLTSAKSKEAMTFLVRFIYPNASFNIATANRNQSEKPLPKGFDPTAVNLDYSVSGNKALMGLSRVFDDGQFTYFSFDKHAEIPAFYAVNTDGSESIVNTRREGNYMVVERLASRLTLRNGTTYLCVRNNANLTKYQTNNEGYPLSKTQAK